jgi:ATP-binding protein involved in chromosome partitioning
METTNLQHSDPHAPGALPQPAAGSEKLPRIHHIVAVGQRQGRRRKIHAVRQSGARVAAARGARRAGRRRCFWPQYPRYARHPNRSAAGANPGRQDDPGGAARSEGGVDGHAHRRRQPGRLARADGGQIPEDVRRRCAMGTAGDLPPGTRDTQLTLAQSMPLSGVVIVTRPQNVSLKIARRGLRMFEKVQVPILGIVENMRTFTCPHCGQTTDIFRRGGGHRVEIKMSRPAPGSTRSLPPAARTGRRSSRSANC